MMMFRRRLQISIDRPAVHWVRDLPRKFLACEHIRVDLGSAACSDMTHTREADIYLGDVSSQVCEFLLRPRPCVFANAHGVAWRSHPSYEAWRLGSVFDEVADLPAKLDEAIEAHPTLASAQARYVRETFDLSDEPSARRAAKAISEYLSAAERSAD
jgi:hypothetical protein